MLIYDYGHWDYWDLNHKVTFDGENKLIYISDGITEIDVKTDLYSSWKEWSLLRDNTKYPQAMSSIGGEPLPGGRFVGGTFFLLNGWRIRTWEGNHTLTLTGNMFTQEGDPVFIPTLESWTITINSFQSTLIDGVSGLTSTQDAKLMGLPTSTLTTEEHNQLMSIPSSGAQLNISGLTQVEHDKLMSLVNANVQDIIDGVWDKVLPNGQTAKDYIVYKLLTTNKFIALQ